MTKKFKTHMFIPDTQVRSGVKLDHIAAAGNYAAEKKPDRIIIAGDWWDMASLSAWDSAASKTQKKRIYMSEPNSTDESEGDIDIGNRALDMLMKPINAVNKGRRKKWLPDIHFTMGNHEHRLTRFKSEHPYLGGALSLEHCNLRKYGIKVHPFLKPVVLDGIHYCHYFCRSAKGTITSSRGGQSSAMAQVKNESVSTTAGHKQGLDVHIQESSGGRMRGLIAGSFYQHTEGYMGNGYQGQNHWHGILMKHEVRKGDYDLMEVSIDYLQRRYS